MAALPEGHVWTLLVQVCLLQAAVKVGVVVSCWSWTYVCIEAVSQSELVIYLQQRLNKNKLLCRLTTHTLP